MNNLYYLTIKEAAKKVNLSTHFVRTGVLNGEIPAIMCGDKYMVNMPGFYEYLHSIERKM